MLLPHPLGPTSTANAPLGDLDVHAAQDGVRPERLVHPADRAALTGRAGSRAVSMGVSIAAGGVRVEAAVMAPGFDMVACAFDSALSDYHGARPRRRGRGDKKIRNVGRW